MLELKQEQYFNAKKLIKDIGCETVYVNSIVEHVQKGKIFTDTFDSPKWAIYWHYCGFAYASGDFINDDFRDTLYKLLSGRYEENQKRFKLLSNNENLDKIVSESNIPLKTGTRYRFRFNREHFYSQCYSIPNTYEIKAIDKTILDRLQGRIIPSFSWDTSHSFLENGKGFCMIHNNDIVCTSFSSSIGRGVMDIGIETNPNYRGKGLGIITAGEMVSYVLDRGYEPCWMCDAENIGSASIAKKLGFELIDSHKTYVKL